MRLRLLMPLLLALGVLAFWISLAESSSARAQFASAPTALVQLTPVYTQPPPPDMPPLPQGLDPPPTVYPPNEISKGSNVYYLVCMACHGDRGQGLTDEWRGMLDPPDQNCWQSKCHHANHPIDGFVFPKYVPPVTGPIMFARFQTGLDLYEYLVANMPFQAPGSRSEEEYWQLTAFLLSLNGVDPGGEPLDAARAAKIFLSEPPVAMPTATPVSEPSLSTSASRLGGAIGIFVLAAVAFVFFILMKPFKERS